jgi:hypothetical protein
MRPGRDFGVFADATGIGVWVPASITCCLRGNEAASACLAAVGCDTQLLVQAD